jgi:dihydrofolate synthase/folylpolyglutamate synthase
MLSANGKRVGCYTSPHLLRYNERVRVCGSEVGDSALIDAFERIEAARAEIPLTYFEFGTLAALWIFAHGGLDVAVLEVGLGGRLDAVNIVDADAAIVTTIDLDHQDWLGNDRNTIGREKAGIFRSGRPAIIGTHEPPAGLLDEALRIRASLVRAGVDFDVAGTGSGWKWSSGEIGVDLPAPELAAPCQVDNAAAAIAVLHSLRDRLGWNPVALAGGVRNARLEARLQRFASPGAADVIVDVAHNPQAAGVLAQWLRSNPSKARTFAIFGALDDKDVAGMVAPLLPHVDGWFLAGLDESSPRGLKIADLKDRIRSAAADLRAAAQPDPRSALAAARAQASPADRIIAFGSFYVAAEVLAVLNAEVSTR